MLKILAIAALLQVVVFVVGTFLKKKKTASLLKEKVPIFTNENDTNAFKVIDSKDLVIIDEEKKQVS